MAKFHGDRPTELGNLVATEEKKTSAVKHKAFRTNVRAAKQHGNSANQNELMLELGPYLKGGIETAADGDVPPPFTCRVKLVLC